MILKRRHQVPGGSSGTLGVQSFSVDGGGGLPPGAKVNLNTAARDELMLLPGVGEITANRIIENRPYKKVEDLTKVSGIGEGTLKKLRESLAVE